MRLEAFFAAKMPYGYHERLRWERRFSYGSFSSTKVLWQSDDTGWRFSAFSGNLVCLRGLASATLLIMSLESTAAPNCSWKVSQKLSRNFNTRAKAQGSCCQEISHHLSIYSNLNNFSKLNIVSTLLILKANVTLKMSSWTFSWKKLRFEDLSLFGSDHWPNNL